VHIGCVGGNGTCEILGLFLLLALILVVAMIAFHKGILFRCLRRTNLGLDPQTLQEAKQGRRKILRRPTADPTGIPVHTDPIWAAVFHQHVCHGAQGGLRRVIAGRCGGDHGGRAVIDHVQDFHYMSLLAAWIGRDTADIVKIHAPFHPGIGSLFRIMLGSRGTYNAVISIQDLPDRPRRTRQPDPCSREALIPGKVI
jgi:hypothetical protein